MYSDKAKAVLQKIICCPQCREPLWSSQIELKCSKGHSYRIVDDIIMFRKDKLPYDVSLSLRSWDKVHQKFTDNIGLIECEKNGPYVRSYQYYTETFFNFQPESVFLDVGCGIAYNSFFVAQKNIITVNVDVSLNALRISRDYFYKNGQEGLFICADILNLPFQDKSFDFIFSTMSLEYFEDTEGAVKCLSGLLKKRGSIFAVLPIVSFSTIYYQLSGSLPNLPILKQLIKFAHIRIFGGRLLKHGYDRTFTVGFLKKIFNRYFQQITFDFFETDYELEFLRYEKLKKFGRKILKLRPFWPLIYIYAKK